VGAAFAAAGRARFELVIKLAIRFFSPFKRSLPLINQPRMTGRSTACFARIELALRDSVGVGACDGADPAADDAVRAALSRADIADLPERLPDGLDSVLDPMAEHALFERFAVVADAQETDGAVTVYVSHRFSTARMADMIIVLAGGTVAACGTHDELMRAGGTYHELYTLQARAYATS
jgi:ATP-binding cassette, subfamily B, bacterial